MRAPNLPGAALHGVSPTGVDLVRGTRTGVGIWAGARSFVLASDHAPRIPEPPRVDSLESRVRATAGVFRGNVRLVPCEGLLPRLGVERRSDTSHLGRQSRAGSRQVSTLPRRNFMVLRPRWHGGHLGAEWQAGLRCEHGKPAATLILHPFDAAQGQAAGLCALVGSGRRALSRAHLRSSSTAT